MCLGEMQDGLNSDMEGRLKYEGYSTQRAETKRSYVTDNKRRQPILLDTQCHETR
jgi:hypothetical protein